MKKSLLFFVGTLLLFSSVVTAEYNIEISTIPSDKIFSPGDTFQLRIIVYDESSKLADTDVLVTIEDVKESIIKELTIKSNTLEDVSLPENLLGGEGKIRAKIGESEAVESFYVEPKPSARFSIEGDKFTITNTGNTKYNKRIYITIGETTGAKSPNLDIGESVTYRLVAPDGVYDIQIKEEGSNIPIFEEKEIKLTGTGNVIGALDDSSYGRSPLTGGISPDEDSEGELLSYFKSSSFVYVFVLVVFGATILLAIERRYKKKA